MVGTASPSPPRPRRACSERAGCMSKERLLSEGYRHGIKATHNPKVAGSNPARATIEMAELRRGLEVLGPLRESWVFGGRSLKGFLQQPLFASLPSGWPFDAEVCLFG